MQAIREIYSETLAKLELVLSRHMTELQQLEFVLDNDIVSSSGGPLPEAEMADIVEELNTNIDEVKADIVLIESQIVYITKWIESYK